MYCLFVALDRPRTTRGWTSFSSVRVAMFSPWMDDDRHARGHGAREEQPAASPRGGPRPAILSGPIRSGRGPLITEIDRGTPAPPGPNHRASRPPRFVR